MDKKGQAQTFPLAILSALAVLIVGMMFVNFLLPEISTARIDLNCDSASTIHDGNKILCLVTDGIVPYVIVSVFSLLAGIITMRMKL